LEEGKKETFLFGKSGTIYIFAIPKTRSRKRGVEFGNNKFFENIEIKAKVRKT